MNKQFNDSSVVIHYIQQMLKNNFNADILVNSQYYTNIDMQYGLAHHIASYLDKTYPILDKQTQEDYKHIQGTEIRDITSPISITNYFLSDNLRHRLTFSEYYTDEEYNNLPDQVKQAYNSEPKRLYREIYNTYLTLKYEMNTGNYVPRYPQYINKLDLPLFSFVDNEGDYIVNNNTIFTLQEWGYEKKICELDDLVTSYILGRTITPRSSMSSIYYVQKLLIQDRTISKEEKGIWCLPGMEGTEYDLTQTIINYQKIRVNSLNGRRLFVTGYFDTFTEACVLKEVGVNSNGILGL